MALSVLRCQIKADELMFWGKVTGVQNDYYIAVSITYKNMYEFPQKTFYYTLSNTKGFTFREMPSLGLPEVEQDRSIDCDNSLFTGNPSKKLGAKVGEEGEEAVEEPPKEEEEGEEGAEKKAKDSDASEDEEVKIPKRNLTEIDRLTAVVLAIENDCQLCPTGAFKMTPDHQLKRNEAFSGLNGTEALKKGNYMHFRNVQTIEKKRLLETPEAPFTYNFLENISREKPQGCWSLQRDERHETVIIRSLIWPGYHFFHKISSSKFGGMYIGDGLKNAEVHFIV